MSIESVIHPASQPSNYLILCHPLLLLPSILPSIRVFSSESVLRIRWPKYWSFSVSISPSNEYSGLISFRTDWFDPSRNKYLLEITPKKKKKRYSLHHRGLECKSRKSRDTWNNRQVWPWSTKWSRAKVNRLLPRECTGHSKHPLPTTQEKTLHIDVTRWSMLKSDWLYSLQPKIEKLSTVSKSKTESWLWLRSWTPYCQIQT